MPPASDGQPPSEQVAAAQALQQATERFAQAQRATGQGAVEISGQEEVANEPIREGLQAASELELGLDEPIDELPLAAEPLGPAEELAMGEGQPTGEAVPAEGQPSGDAQTMAQGEPTGDMQPAASGQPTGEGQPQPPGQGQPTSSASELGTGFVPESPEVTAAQIAGSQAMAQAAETLAQAQMASAPANQPPGQTPAAGQTETQVPGQGQPADQPVPGPGSSLASAGGVSVGGESPNTQEPPPGPLELQPPADGDSRTADSDADADVKQRMFKEEPWFAKLPPTLRDAIRARARRHAPRGYEERLRRYFESID